jgi:CheY-like chemotaxis protein
MNRPILIIAKEDAARTVANFLQRELDRAVEIASSRRAGLATLRRAEYSLILLDENLAVADVEITESLYEKALATQILEINFALCNSHRILRQVRAAFTRRAHDQVQARKAATIILQNDLKSSVTGLLLESQLALREAQPSNVAKLRHLVELAGDLRNRLCA